MREPTSSQPIQLTDQQTLQDTMLIGRKHIQLSANGYRCQTDDLWRILLAAAARATTETTFRFKDTATGAHATTASQNT